MRTLPVFFLVLSMGALGAVAACSGGDDQTDGGSDATPPKKEAGPDVSADVPVTCSAAASYSSVSNQGTNYTPTPADGGADAAPDAPPDATGDAADDGASADASDDTTTDATDDGSADAGVDDGSADAMADAGSNDGGIIGGPSDVYLYNGTLDVNSDLLDIEVYAGYGVFTGGVHTGQFKLGASDLNYGTCGLCVLVYANGQNDPYMATGGTVTFTSFQGTFAGTLSNMTFTHVSIDPNSFQSTPVGDGCNTSIPSLSFSSSVTTQ